DDATTWQEFGRQIAHRGLMQMYPADRQFNHPPLPGLWATLVYRITHGDADVPDVKQQRKLGLTFPFVFKSIDFVADVIVCFLLWKILRPRYGPGFAALSVVLFAWCIDSILMTSHHGNDDPVYAMLCLLAVYLIEDRGHDFWGGVALGAA